MPQLTLDVTPEVATRLRAAYEVATNAELKAAIIHQIKDKVKQYEAEKTNEIEQAKIQAAQVAKNVAVTNIELDVETKLILV